MEPVASTGSKKSKTEGVDVTSFMSNLSMSSSVPVTINDLSLEVLEEILDRLDDRASLLNCRLVHPNWKDAAVKVLENLCLSSWTRWNPWRTTTMPGKKSPHFGNFPKIRSTTVFPFPFRSLYLDDSGWEEYKKTNEAAEMEMFQLFKLFGSHLTSLWIEEMSLDRVQISMMFNELVNLKALTISLPTLCTRQTEATATEEATSNSPPLNIKYLRLMWDSIEDCDLAQWIVDRCSSQLISLETLVGMTSKRQPRRFLQLPSSSEPTHLHFTKLKLWGVISDILEQTVRLPLTHLSIRLASDHSHRQITLKDVITFLNNFSGTLVQLYLRVFLGLEEDEGIIPFNEFPRLTELFIWFLLPSDPDRNPLTRLTYLHEVFLTRFPNLERLRLFNCEVFGEEIEMEQVRQELNSHFFIQRCFQLCQTLKTVTVNLQVAAGDSLRSQSYEITVSRDGDQLWKLC